MWRGLSTLIFECATSDNNKYADPRQSAPLYAARSGLGSRSWRLRRQASSLPRYTIRAALRHRHRHFLQLLHHLRHNKRLLYPVLGATLESLVSKRCKIRSSLEIFVTSNISCCPPSLRSGQGRCCTRSSLKRQGLLQTAVRHGARDAIQHLGYMGLHLNSSAAHRHQSPFPKLPSWHRHRFHPPEVPLQSPTRRLRSLHLSAHNTELLSIAAANSTCPSVLSRLRARAHLQR